MDKLIEQLKKHEGFRGRPYRCSTGKLTIGYGLNLDEGISEEEATYLLRNRIGVYLMDLRRNIPFFDTLGPARQNVLINMCYNLGITKLMKFVRMISALEQRDFRRAAIEMLRSKWAVQVGKRAVELAESMESGEESV